MMTRLGLALCLVLIPGLGLAQEPSFGDDSGEYTLDGECDDRRFFGPGTAKDVDSTNIGRDATDCRRAFRAGTIAQWNMDAARQVTV